MLALAGPVIRQRLQHSARLPVGLAIAGHDNPHQFLLKASKAANPVPYLRDPLARNAVRVAMGVERGLLQRDQLGNRLKVKPQLSGMGDERQPIEVRIAISALTALSAAGIREEASPLIKPDRRHLHARALGQSTNGMTLHRISP